MRDRAVRPLFTGLPGVLLLAVLLPGLPAIAAAVEQYRVTVVDQRPQPRDHFVQGLAFQDGQLYVGTGNYGESRLLRYRFDDGELLDERPLSPAMFGEGVTVLGDHVYQLTWKNRRMLVYRRADLALERSLPIAGEGWGITHDGRQLIYSDGSPTLRFLDPADGRVLRTLRVTEHGAAVPRLNELEWVDGRIWANVWLTDRIVVIDPDSGAVTASIDLRGLLQPADHRAGTDVLNGIAHNPVDDAIWVTGKRWPWLFRIELRPLAPTDGANHPGDDSG